MPGAGILRLCKYIIWAAIISFKSYSLFHVGNTHNMDASSGTYIRINMILWI